MTAKHFERLAGIFATALLVGGCADDGPASVADSPSMSPVAENAGPADSDSLLAATRAGDAAGVRALLQSGANVNTAAPDGSTPLIEAAGRGDTELVEILLEAGADARVDNRYGMSALHLAARNGDARSVTALLEAGADPARTLPEGETVLMAAARSGNVEVVDALLQGRSSAGSDYGNASIVVVGNAADPNAREGWYGQTALMWAAAAGNTAVMQRLIEAGADVDQASARIDAPEIEPDRMQGGFVYAKIPEGRMTALHFAARDGQLEAARVLIEAGADLNIGDNYETTPVTLAVLNGHLGVAAALLEAGADPNAADRYGRTPLFVATDLNTLDVNPRPAPPITGGYRPIDIVRLALEKGADVDAGLSDEGLPAWVAQGGTHNPMLYEGATALFRAAMSGDVEIMRVLLDAGADPNIVTGTQVCKMPADQCERSYYMLPDGETTAFQAAAGVGWRLDISRGSEPGAIEAMQLLLDLGADVNASNQNGNTALHGAALRQSPAIIEFLVANGADLGAANDRGWLPLDIATGQPDFRILPNEEIATLLRRLMEERGIATEG